MDKKDIFVVVISMLVIVGAAAYFGSNIIDERGSLAGQAHVFMNQGSSVSVDSTLPPNLISTPTVFSVEDLEAEYDSYKSARAVELYYNSESEVEDEIENLLGINLEYDSGTLWESRLSGCAFLCGINGHDQCLFRHNQLSSDPYGDDFDIVGCDIPVVPSMVDSFSCYCTYILD